MRCFSLRGIIGREFAGADRALQEQPGGKLHEAGGEAHAFGGVGDGAVAVEQAGILAARAIEVVGGLLDQAHAFPEHFLELFGGGEACQEIDRLSLRFADRCIVI